MIQAFWREMVIEKELIVRSTDIGIQEGKEERQDWSKVGKERNAASPSQVATEQVIKEVA
jgi:hypothetical protein